MKINIDGSLYDEDEVQIGQPHTRPVMWGQEITINELPEDIVEALKPHLKDIAMQVKELSGIDPTMLDIVLKIETFEGRSVEE